MLSSIFTTKTSLFAPRHLILGIFVLYLFFRNRQKVFSGKFHLLPLRIFMKTHDESQIFFFSWRLSWRLIAACSLQLAASPEFWEAAGGECARRAPRQNFARRRIAAQWGMARMHPRMLFPLFDKSIIP